MGEPAVDIWHVAIAVTNLEKSIAFYRDAIGFLLLGRDEDGDEKKAYFAVKLGGFTIELLETKPPRTKKPDHLAFECRDLEKFRDRMVRLGLSVPAIATFKNGVQHFEVKDPDDLSLQFFQGRKIFEAELLEKARRAAP